MKKIPLTLVLALFVLAGTTSASADDSFGLSINLGVPSFYVGPPVVYGPPPVYYPPPPVIYYEPAPAYYGPNNYYGYDDGPRFGHEHGYYRGGYGYYEDDNDDNDGDDDDD